jgi:hypothetical protein
LWGESVWLSVDFRSELTHPSCAVTVPLSEAFGKKVFARCTGIKNFSKLTFSGDKKKASAELIMSSISERDVIAEKIERVKVFVLIVSIVDCFVVK